MNLGELVTTANFLLSGWLHVFNKTIKDHREYEKLPEPCGKFYLGEIAIIIDISPYSVKILTPNSVGWLPIANVKSV